MRAVSYNAFMRVALLANTAWLDEELTNYQHLVVGLLGEQVLVTPVVPETFAEPGILAAAEPVTWRDSAWALGRRLALLRLTDQLGHLSVDLIHALDGRLWDGAVRLALRLETPVVLRVGSALDLRAVPTMLRLAGNLPLVFTAATQPFADAVSAMLPMPVGDESRLTLIPPGVYVAPQSELPAIQDQTLCIVISGSGAMDEAYLALLAALRQVIGEHSQVQLFFDSQGRDDHALWQAARAHGLLAHMSMVPRRLGHRELLLHADVLIHPQPLGRARTLLLQAMARGLPVLARRDQWVDYLIDDQTCWMVDRDGPNDWLALIRRLVDEPKRARILGHAARQWVREHHSASQQVVTTLNLYRRLVAHPIKFPGSAAISD